ncbi:MAG: NAD(+)/NADH kinase [bacterium]
MTTVGVIVNTTRLREHPETVPQAKTVVEALARGAQGVLVTQEAAHMLGVPSLASAEEELTDRAELLVVLGGDGTILRAARLAAGRGIPIVGVNMGGFGFLAELSVDELPGAMPALLTGRYDVDERMMLQAQVEQGRRSQTLLALNDVVVTKSGVARVLRLRISVNGEHLASYPADGVIVATPTGSTAYSLSAGGPIVHPRVEAIVITPICPHTFNARSVIVDQRDAVTVEVEAPASEAMLTVDGREGLPLEQTPSVLIQRAAPTARFVRLRDSSFYSILSTKLAWGGR